MSGTITITPTSGGIVELPAVSSGITTLALTGSIGPIGPAVSEFAEAVIFCPGALNNGLTLQLWRESFSCVIQSSQCGGVALSPDVSYPTTITFNRNGQVIGNAVFQANSTSPVFSFSNTTIAANSVMTATVSTQQSAPAAAMSGVSLTLVLMR